MTSRISWIASTSRTSSELATSDQTRQLIRLSTSTNRFLAAYDKDLKNKRGVFFTPRPVVSYIVRSVHELLQTELRS